MTPFTGVIMSVAALFATLLVLKSVTKLRFCVICASIGLTWVALLALYRLGAFHDPVVIALFMGQSVVGVYYLAEKRLPERFKAFRLPFLLTATYAAYALLAGTRGTLIAAAFLAALWLGLSVLHVCRRNPRVKTIVDRLVACCRDW